MPRKPKSHDTTAATPQPTPAQTHAAPVLTFDPANERTFLPSPEEAELNAENEGLPSHPGTTPGPSDQLMVSAAFEASLAQFAEAIMASPDETRDQARIFASGISGLYLMLEAIRTETAKTNAALERISNNPVVIDVTPGTGQAEKWVGARA